MDTDNLIQLLKLQTCSVSNLLVILQEETIAIASKKALNIENAAKKKLAVITEVTKQDQLLAQYLQGASISAENIERISQIKSMLNQCRQHNDANGFALQRASLCMHKLKNLFEESMGKEQMTYDGKGKTSGAHTLGTNVKV